MPNRFLVSLVLAAATVLLAAAPAGAAPARAANLSPPVVHEPFTPLPCTGAPGHRTTLEMEGCAEMRILASDGKIDALKVAIFGRLFDDAARRRFIAGHNAWLTYRRAYCLSASDVFEGGTAADVGYADCVAGDNSEHVKELGAFRAALGPVTG